MLLGDNLGLNSICGFVESFKANYFCRVCKVTSKESEELALENKEKLRTKSNYELDVQVADASKTGIKEPCVFNNVKGFHITENISVDLMHDVLEGVCMYIMRSIIYTFIFTKEYFTLQELNTRIQCFSIHSTEQMNKPPIITLNRLKNKLNLKISAVEMAYLVQNFGLIIGDLISIDDIDWKLYITLRHVTDILFSPRIVREDAKILHSYIQDLNNLYKQLYGTLKPKFHHLTHYPELLLKNGPIINFWSMRYESSHRNIKSTAQSTSSNKNLLQTIGMKLTLKMCQMMHSVLPLLSKINHQNDLRDTST